MDMRKVMEKAFVIGCVTAFVPPAFCCVNASGDINIKT